MTRNPCQSFLASSTSGFRLRRSFLEDADDGLGGSADVDVDVEVLGVAGSGVGGGGSSGVAGAARPLARVLRPTGTS